MHNTLEGGQAGLLDLAHDAIIVRNLDGRIGYWNLGAETLYGWSKDQAAGKVIHELLQTIFPAPLEGIERTLLQTRRWDGELRHTVRDGGTVTVSSRWAIRDGEANQMEILEINRDLTSQKRVEQGFLGVNRELETRVAELRRAEQRFRALVECAPDAMVIADASGQIVLVNAQTEKLFGFSRYELLGQSMDMLMPERFRDRHQAHLSAYVSGPRTRPMGEHPDLFGLRKNGEEFPVEIALSPIETAEGVLSSSSIRDVSERKRFEKAQGEEHV